jgi:F0F1-type ATP synthase membrane subunit b/b'
MNVWIREAFRKLSRVAPLGMAAILIEQGGILRAVWKAISDSAAASRSRVRTVIDASRELRSSLSRLASETQANIRQIRTRLIPESIADAVAATRRWATDRINATRDRLRGEISAVERDARTDRARIRRELAEHRSWTQQRLADVHNRINDLTRALRHVLSGPRVLADWLTPDILRAILAWMRRNEVAIALWIVRSAVGVAVTLVGRIERILGRLI